MNIEKCIWTETDFDLMGWHDATLYATAFLPEQNEFLLDIDYIFEWVEPKQNETFFKFWISPATLVFENIHNFSLNIGEQFKAIQIQSIERKNPKQAPNAGYINRGTEWRWFIDLEVGEIEFNSIGFKLFIRKSPILTKNQSLTTKERGGISFSMEATQSHNENE